MGAVTLRQASRGEQGFTIVEVMVAMVVMLVGVLGTLVLIEGSMASTSATSAREQGTNVARDLLERARQAPYASVTKDLAPQTLRATLPASDNATALAGPTFKIMRRNVVYTVTVFACSIDDPTDGAGVGNATFCATPGSTTVPATPPGTAAAVNVLGIEVALGGSLLSTVCQAVGGDSALLNQLTAAASIVTPISVCPAGAGTGTVQYDSQPDDLRRVRVDVSWTRGQTAGSLSQTTLLTSPR